MATCAYDPQKTAETWDRIHEASETGALRQSSQTSQLSQSGSQMAPSNWTLFHILRRHFEQNNTPLSPRIVVDLGSGTGDTLLSLANEVGDNVHLLGSDISAEAVRQANTKAVMMGIGAKVKFLHAAVENFPWGNVPNLAGCPRGTIAAVNVDHVLQYLSPDIRHDMMVSIGKHMALGGILRMRTITPSGPFFENIKIQKEAHPTLPNAFLNHGAFIQFLSPPQLNALFTDDYTPLCDFSTLLTPYQYGVGLRLQSYMRIAQYAPGETRLDPGISRPPFLRYFASTLPPNRYTTTNPMRLLGVGYPSEYSVMQEIKRILAHYYGERFSMAESASPVPDFPDNTFDAIYLTADPHMPNWQGQKGFREKLLSGRCQDALLRLVKPGGVISANVTKPAHLDTVTPSLDTIRASFFCSPEQNPCLVVTEGNVFRGPKKSQHDIVWRLATRVDRKPTGGGLWAAAAWLSSLGGRSGLSV